MRYAMTATLPALLASPALAHPGTHPHLHDSTSLWTVGLIALSVMAAGTLAWVKVRA